MSSAQLLDRTLTYLRSRFTAQEVVDVRPYGGQFSADEINYKSYNCPAIFVAVRGWEPHPDSRRLTGRYVRGMQMSAFVLDKSPDREARMRAAMQLAERVAVALQLWQPDDASNAACGLAPLEEDPTCENLYNRAVDRAGQALWVVHWWQAVKARSPQELWNLLAVDATHRARVTVPELTPEEPQLQVFDDVQFEPQT